MNVIIDPFTDAAYCGACGAVAVDVVHAYECCRPDDTDLPVWRSVAALILVAASIIFLLALPLICP